MVVVDGRVVDDVDVWDVVLVVRADPVVDVGRVVDVGEPAVVLGVVGCGRVTRVVVVARVVVLVASGLGMIRADPIDPDGSGRSTK